MGNGIEDRLREQGVIGPAQSMIGANQIVSGMIADGAIADRDKEYGVLGHVTSAVVLDPTALVPAEGEQWLINGIGLNGWAGQDYNLARYVDGIWTYPEVKIGQYVFDDATDDSYIKVAAGIAWELGMGTEADDIVYDPAGSTTPLVATDVGAAIDELDLNVATHIADTVDAHEGTAVGYDPATSTTPLVAIETQAAIDELDLNVATHIADTVDAHEGTAVGYDPATSTTPLVAIETQAAIDELDLNVATHIAVVTGNPHVVTGAEAAYDPAGSTTPLVAVLVDTAINELDLNASVEVARVDALGAANIDGEIATDFLRGVVESGIWAATIAGGLPALTRTAAAGAEIFWIPALIPTRSTALKGRMITGLVANYTVGGAILDEAIFELYKLTLAADLAAPTTAIEVVTYDALHDTAAERGAIKDHRQVATVTAPDYLAEDEQLWIKLTVDGDAGPIGTFVLTGLKVLYTETLVDLA